MGRLNLYPPRLSTRTSLSSSTLRHHSTLYRPFVLFVLLNALALITPTFGQGVYRAPTVDTPWEWPQGRWSPAIPSYTVKQSDYGSNEVYWTGCYNRTRPGTENMTYENIVLTQACLDWYYWGGLTDNWEGAICNKLDFFRGSFEYENSEHCYKACYKCLSASISAGSTNSMCRDAWGIGAGKVRMHEVAEPQNLSPHCWIGFQPRPSE